MAMITASLLGRCGRRQLPRVLAAAATAISSHKLQNSAAAAALQTRIFRSYFASLNSATDVHFTLRRSISTSLPSLGLANYDDNSKNEERTILFEGCDYNHWLVTMHFPDPQPSREEKIDTFIKTLAQVVGSEEEAKKRIYALSTTTYTGFQAEISEELSEKLKGLPGVEWVLPDSYIDPVNKEYGGDKYINGVIIPDTRVYNNRPANKNKYRGSYSNSPGNQQGFNRSGDQQRINRSPLSYGDQQHINRTPPSYGDQQGPNRTPPSFGPPPTYGDQQHYNNPPPVREQQVYNRPPTPSLNQQEYHRSSPSPANQAGYVSPTVTPRDQQGYYPGALNASSPMSHHPGYNGPAPDPSSPLPPQSYNHQSNFQQPYSGPPNFEYQQGYNYQSMPGGGRNPLPNYQQGYNRPPEINGHVPGYPSQPVDQRGQYTGYQQNYYRPPPPPPPPMDSSGQVPAYQQNYNWPSQSGPVMADNRNPSSSYMDGRPPVMSGYNNPTVPPSTPVQLNESGQRTTDYNGAFRPATTNEQCALRINDSYSSQATNAQDEHRGRSTSWPIEGEQ